MDGFDSLIRTHWGLFRASSDGRRLTGVAPFEGDPDPSDIGQSLLDAVDHPARIRRPHIRRRASAGPGWCRRDSPGGAA